MDDQGLVEAGRRNLRRKRWSVGDKRRVVSESFVPGVSVASVARRYGVTADQVFKWRKLFSAAEGEPEPEANLIPLGIIGSPVSEPGGSVSDSGVLPENAVSSAQVEIELVSGLKLRFDGGAEDPVLRNVLKLARGLSC